MLSDAGVGVWIMVDAKLPLVGATVWLWVRSDAAAHCIDKQHSVGQVTSDHLSSPCRWLTVGHQLTSKYAFIYEF